FGDRVGDVLAREDVLDGLVLEDAATGLGHRELGELAVPVERGDRGLAHDAVDLGLVEGGVRVERLVRTLDEVVDLAAVDDSADLGAFCGEGHRASDAGPSGWSDPLVLTHDARSPRGGFRVT